MFITIMSISANNSLLLIKEFYVVSAMKSIRWYQCLPLFLDFQSP